MQKDRRAKLRQCYVYEIRVDGVVRYIGKGCNDRIYSHLIDAKRTASRPDVKIRNLISAFSENASLCRSARLKHHREIISSKCLPMVRLMESSIEDNWELRTQLRYDRPAVEHD